MKVESERCPACGGLLRTFQHTQGSASRPGSYYTRCKTEGCPVFGPLCETGEIALSAAVRGERMPREEWYANK